MARGWRRWLAMAGTGLLLLTGGALMTQRHDEQPPPPPPPRMTGEAGTFGMVLIDISDAKTALFYHVDDFGVYVLAVDESSQAYAGGVRSGDRIVSANGVLMDDSSELTALCSGLAPGQELVLQLDRGEGEKRITVTLTTDSQVSV